MFFNQCFILYYLDFDCCFGILKVEAHGLDNYWGTLYIGTGCFHRRETLCGKKFSKGYKIEMKWEDKIGEKIGIHELEESSKSLASCTFEENTQWGKEVSTTRTYKFILT